MTRVVVTDHAFPAVERERAVAERAGAEFSQHRCRTEAETAQALTGADVALVNFAPVTAAVLAAMAPGATVVRYGVGVDNVDLDAARAAGVAVANVPDYGSDTVADHATACLLALLRKLPAYDRAVREEGWIQPAALSPLPGSRSTTVGLVGTGRIGSAVAARLAPFGFTVLAHDPFADPAALAARGIVAVGLEELLERSHAISLHLPLTDATRHLLDDAALARVRRGAVLVNTARGGLVDTGALVRALQDGRLGAAALDVTEPEPLPADSPLRRLPGVLLTPHAAYFSDDSVADLQRLAAEEVERALAGRPLRCRVA
ncbi:C-terminal binding protein [Kineococcus indalonis]|uniref:C-terminal binding protein n=1 Tax=Kineococcus indalonis TaxID=2696566 RepID=UPI001411B75C|nr:C-terminal binding protein [Kineococcus indalonis]NAZ87991.1 C-terminal binding protein [Kineococcus indalonis]